MVGENCHIHGVQITKKCIFESKNLIYSFLLMFLTQRFPPVLIIIIIQPRQNFLKVEPICCRVEKEEETMRMVKK